MWLAIVVVGRDVLILVGYAIIYFLVEERLASEADGRWVNGAPRLQLLTLAVALVTAS